MILLILFAFIIIMTGALISIFRPAIGLGILTLGAFNFMLINVAEGDVFGTVIWTAVTLFDIIATILNYNTYGLDSKRDIWENE